MNVLLDHCVPKPFGRLLTGHFVRTSEFMGWDHLQNGDLLDAAAPQYEVLVTVDKSMRFEQHLGDLPMTVISLVARTNRAIDLAPLSPEVLRLLGTKLQRRVYVVGPLGPHPTP